jgi:hypothetical protein
VHAVLANGALRCMIICGRCASRRRLLHGGRRLRAQLGCTICILLLVFLFEGPCSILSDDVYLGL